MSAAEAASLLRPPLKRNKGKRNVRAGVPIEALVRQAHTDTSKMQTTFEGLHAILAVPANQQPQSQGLMLCALLQQMPAATRAPSQPAPAPALSSSEDTEASPWPSATLNYTQFDTWLQSDPALKLPQGVLAVLQDRCLLFSDAVPPGLPPKRPYDHHIVLVPGKLPSKAALYKMPPDQLPFHQQELAKLLDQGWIGPTYSPICAPTIMVDKRDDGTGQRKMRMVVNYQELNKLTRAPDFPLPSVQTILEMLDGARYFSTLDLKAGFHQIRVAKKDRWKTAFRSPLGLFEYKVMPFGLKGPPLPFRPISTRTYSLC